MTSSDLEETFAKINENGLRGVISSLAVASTCVLMTTPIPEVWKIIQRGSTAGSTVGFVSVLAMLLNNAVGFSYGIISENNEMLIVNGPGSLLCLFYALIFLRYSETPKEHRRQFLLAILTLGMYVVGLDYYGGKSEVENDEDRKIDDNEQAMLGSPLSKAATVVKKKSTANVMSLKMSLTCLGNSFFWGALAHSINDPYLLLSAGIGLMLAVFQLSLFVIYPSTNAIAAGKKKKNDDDDSETLNSDNNTKNNLDHHRAITTSIKNSNVDTSSIELCSIKVAGIDGPLSSEVLTIATTTNTTTTSCDKEGEEEQNHNNVLNAATASHEKAMKMTADAFALDDEEEREDEANSIRSFSFKFDPSSQLP
eukprot:jgi/Bigna1/88946/estExt_fgenesh1_pg.C_410008